MYKPDDDLPHWTPRQRERVEAMSSGAITYLSPRPCNACGHSERYSKTGLCVFCQRARVSKDPDRRSAKGVFSFKLTVRLHPSDVETVRAFVEGLNAHRQATLPPKLRQRHAAASPHPRRP